MKSILKTLTDSQKDALIALCEEYSYDIAAKLAREQLNITLSPSTLCRLYSTHKIAEDRETRLEYARAGAACRRNGGRPISSAKQTCASRSSGWWIRDCA